MAAATEVEETEGGNEHNGLKHRQNPEKHVVYKRKLQIQPPPLETRAEEAPPPPLAPQTLEEAPPVLLEPHLTKKILPALSPGLVCPLPLPGSFILWGRFGFLKEYDSVGKWGGIGDLEGSCWGVLVFWRRRVDQVGRTGTAPRFGSLEVKIGVSKQGVFVRQCKREGVNV
ncbi:hypothetical protein FH972_000968 [Carpinus fangiana]|uniref:Uncharacterized protein n=1 Tax=Carpinus fangiana TaxID=176857 RepID=A0A5N6QC47_9ROSI|nr:hypothetical protein FH972_000968 [Carpinus fangiana]